MKEGLSSLDFELFSSLTELLFDMERPGRWNEVLSAMREATGAKCAGLFVNAVGFDGNEGGVRKAFSKKTGTVVLTLPTWVPYREVPAIYDALSAGLVYFGKIPEQEKADKFCVIPLSGEERSFGFIAFSMDEPAFFESPSEITKVCRIVETMASAIREDNHRKTMKSRDSRLNFVIGMSGDVVLELGKDYSIEHLWGNPPSGLFRGSSRRSSLEGSSLVAALSERIAAPVFALVGSSSGSQTTIQVHGTDATRFLSVSVAKLPSGDDDDFATVLIFKEVTSVIEGDARHRMLVEAVDKLDEALIDLSDGGMVENASAGWGRLLDVAGYVETGVYGKLSDYVSDEFVDQVNQGIELVLSGTSQSEMMKFKMGSGDVWIEAKFFASWSSLSNKTKVRGILRNITSDHLQGELIKKMATHDSMTGIPNRHFMEDTLRRTLLHAERSGEKVAVGFVDCDFFKEINDGFGHKSGDMVLIAISERMRSALRESDMVSRWGGDEFVVMLPGIEDESALRIAEARMREALNKEIEIEGGKKILPSLSMGFAIYPDDSPSDMEELLSYADQAVYAAKASGRGQSKFFSVLSKSDGGRDDPAMRKRLLESVSDGGVQVFYQPFELSSSGVWVECMPRWQDDFCGWLEDELLMETAEHAGVSKDVNEQLFSYSMANASRWFEDGVRGLLFKIGRVQLFSKSFADSFLARCANSGIAPSSIAFAIKESLFVLDMSRSSGAIDRLAAAGFKIVLDRFGTGPSLLPFLKKIPIDMIRICLSDKESDLGISSAGETELVVGLLSWLPKTGKDIVISGISKKDLAEKAKKFKVAVQGDYVLAPAPAGVLSEWLDEKAANLKKE